MQKPLPGSVKHKLESSVVYVKERAQHGGVAGALSFELVRLEHMTRRALDEASMDLAKAALEYERTLLGAIKEMVEGRPGLDYGRRTLKHP